MEINKDLIVNFFDIFFIDVGYNILCGVHGCEVERRPCSHKVPSSIPGSGCQLWDFNWYTHSVRVVPRRQNGERLV